MAAHQPPPGWYIDPGDAARERYWDGTVWTEEYRTAPTRVLGTPERVVEEEPILPEEGVPPEERRGLAIWLAALGAGVVGLLIGLLLGGGGDEPAETVTTDGSADAPVNRPDGRRPTRLAAGEWLVLSDVPRAQCLENLLLLALGETRVVEGAPDLGGHCRRVEML
jgi:hypothetical protein